MCQERGSASRSTWNECRAHRANCNVQKHRPLLRLAEPRSAPNMRTGIAHYKSSRRDNASGASCCSQGNQSSGHSSIDAFTRYCRRDTRRWTRREIHSQCRSHHSRRENRRRRPACIDPASAEHRSLRCQGSDCSAGLHRLAFSH